MIQEIKTFLFILSIVFTLRFIIEFLIKLFYETNPSILVVSKVNQALLYFSISYIITYLIF